MNFKHYLQKRKASKKSIASYLGNAKRFETWLKNEGLNIEIIDQKDILAYLQYCKAKGNCNATLSYILNGLKKYFASLEVQKNPCSHLQIKGIIKRIPSGLLTEEQLNHIYKNYPKTSIQKQRDYTLLGLLVYQGITTAELINLEIKDLNLDLQIVEIKGSLKGQSRRLKLADHQIQNLKNYLKTIRPKLEKQSEFTTSQLIINSGKSQRNEKLKNTIQDLMKQLKKQHDYFINARQIRASRISLWLSEYNLREVQYMAGHRYISSTERYQMGKIEDLQKELDKYHPRK